MTVYFARVVVTGQIKIGHTKQLVRRRLAELRAVYDVEFELLAEVPGDRAEERALHERFSAARTGLEFFRPVPELLAYIEQCAAPAVHRAPKAPDPQRPPPIWDAETRARFRVFVERWERAGQKGRHLRRWVDVAEARFAEPAA